MRPSLLRHWPGLSCLLLAACSSATEEHRPITSTPEDYCQRRCEKAHACTDAINAAECLSACQSALATQPKLRADFLGYVIGCAESSSCESLSTEKCSSEAVARLALSKDG